MTQCWSDNNASNTRMAQCRSVIDASNTRMTHCGSTIGDSITVGQILIIVILE